MISTHVHRLAIYVGSSGRTSRGPTTRGKEGITPLGLPVPAIIFPTYMLTTGCSVDICQGRLSCLLAHTFHASWRLASNWISSSTQCSSLRGRTQSPPAFSHLLSTRAITPTSGACGRAYRTDHIGPHLRRSLIVRKQRGGAVQRSITLRLNGSPKLN
jgi:hypothetical protein